MDITLVISTTIDQSRTVVFDHLIDLRRYDQWLPPSSVFRGTTSIADGPIRPGTTYVESSVWGTRQGTIEAMGRPCVVSYRQPMTLRPRWLGVVDVHIHDTLEVVGQSTVLTRNIRLGFNGPVRFVRRAVARAFRREIMRTHAALKAYAESFPRCATTDDSAQQGARTFGGKSGS